MSRFKFLTIILALVVVGCGQEEPTPEPTMTPAPPATPQPTATDGPPTATSEPTETPLPTETPEPTPTPIPAQTLIGNADEQLLLSDWQGAEETYRQVIANEPDNALAHSRLSYLLQFHPPTYSEALEAGRQAVALAPNDPVIVSFFIMTLTRGGHYEEALSLVEQIELKAYTEAIALGAFVDLQLSLGDFEQAERIFQQAVSISAFAYGIEEVELNRIFAKNYYLTGNLSGANQYSARLEENGLSFAPAYLVRGEVVTSSTLREKTQRELIVEGLILDSDYLPLMVALARIDARAGNYVLAQDSCEDVIRLFPTVVDGLLCEGDVLLEQGLFEEALADFEQVIEQDSQDYRAKVGLGRAYLGLEDCETAETTLLTALDQQPYAFEAFAPLAEAYLCQSKTAEAEAAYAEALALRPNDSATNFSLGKNFLMQTRLTEAEEAFRTALLNAPTGSAPAPYFSNFGQTLTASNQCTRTDPPELGYYLCTGDLFLGQGSSFLAVEAYSLALEIDENAVSALEGTITAYANVRYCDVAEPLLERLAEITIPSDEVSSFVSQRCDGATASPDFGTPDGELISEDEALEIINSALQGIEGAENAFAFFETLVADDPELGEARVLHVQIITNLERDDPELDNQLAEIIFAATEAFVLTDSEPLFLIVQARLSLTEMPVGYFVGRFSGIAWQNGTITEIIFRQTWATFEEIAEQIEQGDSG